ncbi:MAG: hypothetical protein WCO05_04190 [Candidatus Moraniibacteriota bacterium]|jgi:DNA-binding NtrC family response regulator
MNFLIVGAEAFGQLIAGMLGMLPVASTIDFAKTTAEAFRLIEAGCYDFVISELNFDVDASCNGIGILIKEKKINPKAVVILVSAEDIYVDAIKKLGIDCILEKPITTDQVQEAVGNFLEKREE